MIPVAIGASVVVVLIWLLYRAARDIERRDGGQNGGEAAGGSTYDRWDSGGDGDGGGGDGGGGGGD